MSAPIACVSKKSFEQAKKQLVAYTEAMMQDAVLLERLGAPVFNYTSMLASDAATSIYNGKAKCTTVKGGAAVVTGGETEYWDSITIDLPDAAARAHVDDLVTITVTVDPDVQGRVYRVRSVEAGGLMPVGQKLECIGLAASRTNLSA